MSIDFMSTNWIYFCSVPKEVDDVRIDPVNYWIQWNYNTDNCKSDNCFVEVQLDYNGTIYQEEVNGMFSYNFLTLLHLSTEFSC